MLSPAKPLITTFWFYHIKHLIITKLELFFLSVYPACNLLLQSSLCGHSALNQRSNSVEAFAGSLLTWEERRSDSFDLKSVKSLFVSVKVWIICFDLMWFERSTVFVQQVSWSWIYHTKGLFDGFFSAEPARWQPSSRPHAEHFSLNSSGKMRQWHTNLTGVFLRNHPAKNKQFEMNDEAILQRELSERTRGIPGSTKVVWPLSVLLLFFSFFDLFFPHTSALHPSHRLDQEREAGSWSNITFRQQDLQASEKQCRISRNLCSL